MKLAQVDLTYIRGSIPHGKLGPTAKALGMHLATLSRKLRGERPLTVDELNGIAEFLGIGVDKFLRIVETNPEEESALQAYDAAVESGETPIPWE
ncbi:XRE family transcriptional regulator, partial [Candidatus Parcubacteria bacterium]